MEQIIGYRVFRLSRTWRLTSPVIDDIEFHENEAAICRSFKTNHHFHTTPNEFCKCGYWYMNSLEKLREYFQEKFWENINGCNQVFAEVMPFGKVIVTELGGRAEYLKILRLMISSRKARKMKKKAKYPFSVYKPEFFFPERGLISIDECNTDLMVTQPFYYKKGA